MPPVPYAPPAGELRLGVVTPLGNERDTVDTFLDRVLAQLGPSDRVYCVLDRLARDGTREEVQQRSDADPRVVEVWAPEDRCVVDAYFAGYRYAFAARHRWILEMDGGLSHPPEKIPEFITAMEAGFDFAGGSRYLPGGAHRSPITRRILSRGGTLLARAVLHSRMSDMTSGFECFNRAAMAAVLEQGVRSRANFFQTEIRHLMHHFRWTEIPFVYVNHRAAVGRSAVRESFRVLYELARHPA